MPASPRPPPVAFPNKLHFIPSRRPLCLCSFRFAVYILAFTFLLSLSPAYTIFFLFWFIESSQSCLYPNSLISYSLYYPCDLSVVCPSLNTRSCVIFYLRLHASNHPICRIPSANIYSGLPFPYYPYTFLFQFILLPNSPSSHPLSYASDTYSTYMIIMYDVCSSIPCEPLAKKC